MSVAERFEAKVDRRGDCHRWIGAHAQNGYGRFSYEGKVIEAHRAALRLVGVEVPDGMTVDHVWARGCRHRDCVRLDHLEIVSSRENTLRGDSISAINSRKTHCVRGHALVGDNVIAVAKGRNCRRCAELHEASRGSRRGPCPDCGKEIHLSKLALHRSRMHKEHVVA